MPKPINAEIKARALADFMRGMGVREVARKYTVSPETAGKWHAQFTVQTQTTPEQKQDMGDLLLDSTRQAVSGLTAIAQLIQRPTWLEKQDAQGIAILYGVLHDKTVRLLAAVHRAGVDDAGGPGSGGYQQLPPGTDDRSEAD
jgi:transposase-like protein